MPAAHPRPRSSLGPAQGLLVVLAVALACVPEPDPDPDPPGWAIEFESGEDLGLWLSVWGPSPDEVYAVGGQPEAGVVLRYDGERWSPMELPAGVPLVNWIYGFSDPSGTTSWAVANDGVALRRGPEQGAAWELFETGTEQDLWGIWGAREDDLWAVGGDVPNADPDPVLAHYDGVAWTLVPVPELDRSCESLFKVWGSGAERVFAVGRSGVILGWDGVEWIQHGSGLSSDLISLWGTGPDEILAVGGRGSAALSRWDGGSWTSVKIGELPGLNGVWMADDGRATLVGNDGLAIELEAGGFEWTREDSGAFPRVLHAVFGFAEDDHRVAVGGDLNFPPPWTAGVITRRQP